MLGPPVAKWALVDKLRSTMVKWKKYYGFLTSVLALPHYYSWIIDASRDTVGRM
jgi:hypothetical protein